MDKNGELDTKMLEFCAKHSGSKAMEMVQARKNQRRVKMFSAAARVLLCAVSGVFLFGNWEVFLANAQAALQAVGCVASLLIIADSVAKAISIKEE